MTHQAFGNRAEECLAAIGKEAVRLEEILSRYIAGSEISRINQSAGIRSERVSSNTCEVLSAALEFSRQCPGQYDITIAPLVTLWNEAKKTHQVPDHTSIQQVLPLVNYEDLIVNPGERTAALKKCGQSIDPGGIGKGFAGDQFVEIYREYGISSAYSNIGGNVVTLGTKPDGSPWQIGIQHPRNENLLLGSVAVAGKSVVTSGDYQRYFTDSRGIHRHHILSPVNGYPSQSGLVSVSIIADRSMTADGLSTILFMVGMEKGLDILRQYPGSEAIFVDQNLHVWITAGLKDSFQADMGIPVTMIANTMSRP